MRNLSKYWNIEEHFINKRGDVNLFYMKRKDKHGKQLL